ncbi:hypothetical protein EE612_045075, partial [Oryza sativa]
KIFVGGLPRDTTEADFVKHFGQYGEIVDSVIMRDKHTSQPRGFGFITYSNPAVVDRVMDDIHEFNGKQVEIKRTIPKDSVQSKDFKTKKIFVGGLPQALTEDDFKHFFQKYGPVVDHQIMRDHQTKRSRGFGFIVFSSDQVVDDLLANGNMIDLAGAKLIDANGLLCSLHRAAGGADPGRRGATSQGAVVVHLQPPPVDAIDAPRLQHGVREDPHEGHAGVQPGGQHVVVPRPPPLVPAVHDVVEGEPHGAPHEVVHRPRRRHHPRGAEEHRHVDEPDPRPARERPRQRPHRHRRQRAGEEEVVHLGVQAEAAEHPQRADHPPDDGGVEEDVVAGARPRAPLRQLRRVADVAHALQQPPRRPEVHRRRQHRPDELHEQNRANSLTFSSDESMSGFSRWGLTWTMNMERGGIFM